MYISGTTWLWPPYWKHVLNTPSLIALSQLKLNLVTVQKILYAWSLSLYELTKSINLENLEGMDFNTIDSF